MAIGRLRRLHRAFEYEVYIFYVASLRSAQVYSLVFTQFTLCHEPVMLHAVHVSRPINENSSKGGQGRGSQLSIRHKPATVKHIDSV